MLMDDVRGELVLRRLPPEILKSLKPDQVAAIRQACGYAKPRRHPVDARFGLRVPLFGRSYLVLLIGRDLRSPERRAADRKGRTADRLSYIVVMALGAAALLVAALVGMLVDNAIFGA